jgi:multiple sugar transport system permease protein
MSREWISPYKQEKKMKDITRVTAIIIATVLAFFIIFPIIWMFSTSLKGQFDVMSIPPQLIPSPMHWENFHDALTFLPFNLFFKNSVIYSILSVFGELLSCSLVAFGFARLRARHKDTLFLLMLSTMMLPYQVTMIPQYILFNYLKWIDSYKPLIVPTFFGSAYLIFMLRQFYSTIPKEMDEAAMLDGCSYLRIWWNIVLPLSKSALVAVAIFSFMWHWNDYLGPLLYLNSEDKLTVSLGLSRFTASYGGTPWNLLMAASLVFIVPPVVLFFLFQRVFIQGVVISGIKG